MSVLRLSHPPARAKPAPSVRAGVADIFRPPLGAAARPRTLWPISPTLRKEARMPAQTAPPKPLRTRAPRAKSRGKSLTLADVVVTRDGLDRTDRLTGRALAQLIHATEPGRPEEPGYVDTRTIADELTSLAELVQVLGAANHAELGVPLDRALYWVGESLHRASHRVTALELRGTSAPSAFRLAVTR